MAKANGASVSPECKHGRRIPSPPMVYMVGGGIAAMAAAVFMIRDGDVFGHTITILEESD